MKPFFTLVLAMNAFVCSSQLSNPPSLFVILQSGDTVLAQNVAYVHPILKIPQILADNRGFKPAEISKFKTAHGLFAVIPDGKSDDLYAMRTYSGNLSIYEAVDIDPYAGTTISTSGETTNAQPDELAKGQVIDFYTKNDGQLQRANYANLRLDTRDNAEAVKELKRFRKLQWLQRGMVSGGVGMLAGGLMSQTGVIQFNPLMVAGAILGGSSFFLQAPKEDAMWNTFDIYNGKR